MALNNPFTAESWWSATLSH